VFALVIKTLLLQENAKKYELLGEFDRIGHDKVKQDSGLKITSKQDSPVWANMTE
jgi:hypothetical protein